MRLSNGSADVLKDTTRSTRTRTTVLIFSSKESPLTHPIHELLKTEQDYVENLVILVEVRMDIA
jgi:hypothetical protein